MKELRALLEALDLHNVKTYIQSGNVVFQSQEQDLPQLSSKIGVAINERFGFHPAVHLLRVGEFRGAIEANPFPEAQDEPKSLHLFFLETKPQNPNFAILEEHKTDNERYALIDRVFYLHAPDGIGRSKLAEKLGKAINVQMTARNWRTAQAIMGLAKELL
jgi:uncharacterized protein (DUF1697 family)